MRAILASVLVLVTAGCSPKEGSDDTGSNAATEPSGAGEPSLSSTGAPAGTNGSATTGACPPVTDATRALIVSDIDETLTTSDLEWLTQIALPGHDPEMRPDADTMMHAYLSKGYRIVYITSRGENLSLLDGTPARVATEEWLDVHGFPFTSDGVFLAPGLGALGAEAADYKTGVLEDLQAMGFEIVAAYGNADTDIEAYQNVGVPPELTFLVGKLAGQLGVTGIVDADAYTNHLGSFVDQAPCGW